MTIDNPNAISNEQMKGVFRIELFPTVKIPLRPSNLSMVLKKPVLRHCYSTADPCGWSAPSSRNRSQITISLTWHCNRTGRFEMPILKFNLRSNRV
jgi:hypothetical protein